MVGQHGAAVVGVAVECWAVAKIVHAEGSKAMLVERVATFAVRVALFSSSCWKVVWLEVLEFFSFYPF